jgi:hypothetical protein
LPETLSLTDLILARLAMPGKKPPAPAAIHKDVAPLIRGGLSKDRFADVLTELRTAGHLPPKGQALTESGRAHALGVLGLAELPPKCNWGKVKAGFLIPNALGLKPWSETDVACAATADKLAARLIQTKFELPVASDANLSGVLESLVCKLAGFPGCRSLKELAATVISRELQADPPLSVKDAAKLAPRLLLGVAKSGVDGFRMKVLGGSFEDRTEPKAEAAIPRPDLPAFADAVRVAAAGCPTGWSGDDLVLISHVWKHVRDWSEFQSVDLPAFKEKLLAANRERLLTLSRADLVQALDPRDVLDSETTYLNAAFHFLKIRKGP